MLQIDLLTLDRSDQGQLGTQMLWQGRFVVNCFGGRGRDRTCDPLLAKHQTRLHPLFLSLQLLMFPTNRGICFRSKANPNELKTLDSCTLRVQSSPNRNPTE